MRVCKVFHFSPSIINIQFPTLSKLPIIVLLPSTPRGMICFSPDLEIFDEDILTSTDGGVELKTASYDISIKLPENARKGMSNVALRLEV